MMVAILHEPSFFSIASVMTLVRGTTELAASDSDDDDGT